VLVSSLGHVRSSLSLLSPSASHLTMTSSDPYANATFRKANSSDTDVNRIVELVHITYRGDVGWTTETEYLGGGRITPEQVREDLARPRSEIILLERPSESDPNTFELLSCAHIQDENGVGYFGMFSVSPTLQGGGIGKRVIAECERVIRDEFGLSKITMSVIDIRHSLIAFYERRGYRKTESYKNFPYGDERFGIPKRNDLQFVVLEKDL